MRIFFNWTVCGGLESWTIEPSEVANRTIITHTPKRKRISPNLKRVLPRGKESRGQRLTIDLLKRAEAQKKRRAHR